MTRMLIPWTRITRGTSNVFADYVYVLGSA